MICLSIIKFVLPLLIYIVLPLILYCSIQQYRHGVVLLSASANHSLDSALCTVWLHIMAWHSKIAKLVKIVTTKPVKIVTTIPTSLPHSFLCINTYATNLIAQRIARLLQTHSQRRMQDCLKGEGQKYKKSRA